MDSFKNNAESFSSRSAHLGRDEDLNQCDSDVYSLMHISGLIVCDASLQLLEIKKV